MASGKRIVFIFPYPTGTAPSQRFRFEQYFGFLRSKGYTIETAPFLDDKTWKLLYSEGSFLKKALGMTKCSFRRIGLLFRLKKKDILFIHREALPFGPPIFEWFVSKIMRRKFIYDFDDAIWLPNYSKANARFQRIKNYGKVHRIMKWATEIIAGNDYLAEYTSPFNTHVNVIPTTIDTENLHVPSGRQKASAIIGWTGTHSTLHYLTDLLPVIEKLEKKYDFVFRVIAEQNPDLDLRSFDFKPWNKETEIADLNEFSIGVMPLRADKWSSGKCGFKGLQYMSLEIPSVMSPVGVNTKIVTDGVNGFLADSPNEWEKHLEELLVSSILQQQIGKEARKTVLESYSVLSQEDKYLEIIQKIEQ